MNSNLKLLPAALFVAVLALAGCGGGSSDDTMPPPPPPPTPEEACEGAGNNWHEGACYTDQELIDLGVEQGKKDAADAAEEARKAAEAEAAAAAMMAAAMKLHDGISAPSATAAAAYGTGDNANDIAVTSGTASANLSEDKMAMVAALHGWAGKSYTHTVPSTADSGAGDTYEAMVYSNIGEPTPGAKFSTLYTLTAATTDNPGETAALATGVAGSTTDAETEVQARVASPRFDQSAGVKEFELATNAVRVMIPGSYHGVSGTYNCTPANDSTCAVQVAAKGYALGGTADSDNAFTVGGGSWTFKPSNPDALVMSVPDANYASYGWWIHKSADDKKYIASAFVDEKGTVDAASGVAALQGTATYSGGAAGKYALYSATGGMNDAGHFTAAATLEANFNDDTITGTINNFMGADGMSRDWSVELKASAVANAGGINGSAAQAAANETLTNQETVWTIGGDASAASGGWSGTLFDNGDDSVPKVATGTFTSSYSTSGEMVGAFGANKQ